MGDSAHMFQPAGSWSEQVTFWKQPSRIELLLRSVTNSNSSGKFCVTLVTMCSLLYRKRHYSAVCTDHKKHCGCTSNPHSHFSICEDVGRGWKVYYTDSYSYNNLIIINVKKKWLNWHFIFQCVISVFTVHRAQRLLVSSYLAAYFRKEPPTQTDKKKNRLITVCFFYMKFTLCPNQVCCDKITWTRCYYNEQKL